MRLTELDGRLHRYVGNGTFERVATVAEADAVMFLCPACYATNGGPVGTHSVRVDFRGRGTPDEYCVRNAAGEPVRWNATGDTIANLTLTPSIQIESGCRWHGFVTEGRAT